MPHKSQQGRRHSRRKLLRVVAGTGVVAAAAAAETLAKPTPAEAAGNVVLGADNFETSTTSIIFETANGESFTAYAPGHGNGIRGSSDSGIGLVGQGGSGTGVVGVADSFNYTGQLGGPVGVFGGSVSHWGVAAQSTKDTALQAQSFGGIGVVAVGTATGVYGQSGSTDGFMLTSDGVRGFTDSAGSSGVRGENANGGSGVSGSTTSSGSSGPAAVDGSNNGSGPGVRGSGGIGVLAESTGSGPALQVDGKAAFSRAGEVTIGYPAKSATVAVPGGLAGHPLVLALLQTSQPGIFVTSAVPDAATGKVTIHLNNAPGTASHHASVKVAWFIVN